MSLYDRYVEMKKLQQLSAVQRRRNFRLLRQVQKQSPVFVSRKSEFRMAERLHRAGMLTACVSKIDLLGTGRRSFRELALFATEEQALRQYKKTLPRR